MTPVEVAQHVSQLKVAWSSTAVPLAVLGTTELTQLAVRGEPSA